MFSKSREINNLKYSNEKITYNIDGALRYFLMNLNLIMIGIKIFI